MRLPKHKISELKELDYDEFAPCVFRSGYFPKHCFLHIPTQCVTNNNNNNNMQRMSVILTYSMEQSPS